MKFITGLSTAASILGIALLGTTLLNSAEASTGTTKRTERKVITGKKRSPVLVELFTSEGCSSCPSADAALAKLVREQPFGDAEIIPLAQHVDYWNHGGWSDPFSARSYSDRQRNYAQALNLPEIYTPQMIVDGRTEFVGSNQSATSSAIRAASSHHKANINLGVKGDTLTINVSSLPPITKGDQAEVVVAITEDGLSSNVKGGENEGRHLPHVAVVRQLYRVASIDSKGYDGQVPLKLKTGWKRSELSVVVFVQEKGTRRVLGATRVDA